VCVCVLVCVCVCLFSSGADRKSQTQTKQNGPHKKLPFWQSTPGMNKQETQTETQRRERFSK
jgi:hypothetical protein